MTPEFSRPLTWAAVPENGRQYRLAATATECAALAHRFRILGIAFLQAELNLKPEVGGTIRVTGVMEAEVTQSCVVTLEPVNQHVKEAVDARFLPEGRPPSEDPDGPDELFADKGSVDLGEAVAEQLALAMDPYPRSPGATVPTSLEEIDLPMRDGDKSQQRPSPFAVLKGGKSS
ncbi:YceD family protein [Pseudoroseomonas globiformis]|uniref:YceD family protein n=1 Tax=Teichococcus globiformis TaxID=2307229 RepID=A0ABV7G167_9PROT